MLHAKDFDYNININTPQPYLKEAVILFFDVNQSNHDIVLYFDFDIKQDPSYHAQRINIQESDAYHNAQIRYTYLIYPLQVGAIKVKFKLTQKATNDESVAYSFSGDRDNVKTLETKDTSINITPLQLFVKAIPKDTDIVGDFSLDYKIKTHQAQANEPIGIQINIKGLGYPPLLENILGKETAYKQFTQNPESKSTATIKGIQNLIHYPMAISSDKSFTLKAIKINAFNPKKEKSYTLNIPSQEFNISEVKTDTLIDKVDFPPILKNDWQWLQSLLVYFLVFGLGYASALFTRKFNFKRVSIKKYNPLIEKIEQSKSHKALLQVLMAQNDKKFINVIEKLEKVCYGNENVKLAVLKREVKDMILL
jgi:hypothetical protein